MIITMYHVSKHYLLVICILSYFFFLFFSLNTSTPIKQNIFIRSSYPNFVNLLLKTITNSILPQSRGIAISSFQISRNVPQIRITVMLTRTAPTPKEHSSARVTMVTLEMESNAKVG